MPSNKINTTEDTAKSNLKIHTGTGSTGHKKNSTSVLKILIPILIVLIVATLGALVYQKNKSQELAPKTTKLTTEQKINFLANQGKQGEALGVLEKQLSNAKSSDEKIEIYFLLSQVALQFNDYNKAQKYADSALKLNPDNSVVYVTYAHISEAQRDTMSAKKYWQKAIEKLNPNAPEYSLVLRNYQTSMENVK